MQSLVSPGDHWVIWTFLVGMAALSLHLEQRYRVVKKITGCVVAVGGGMLASNTHILPAESPSYDVVWEYVVPLVIPLLLIKIDVRKVFRESGRLMRAFHISALGTIVGTVIAVVLLHSSIDSLAKIAPVMTGSYIGGGVNFVALVSMFDPPEDLVSATLVADQGLMVIYFIVLIMLPGIPLVRRFFPVTDATSKITGAVPSDEGASYRKPKPIGLLDIGTSLAIAFIITTLSVKLSAYFGQGDMPTVVQLILGQQYLLLTTLSVLFPIVFPRLSGKIAGSEELGTFLIFIFFVMIGLPASFETVIRDAPAVALFCAVILFFNFVVTIGLGKLFRFELEELILAGVVTSGGPMNGVAIAIAKNWRALTVPALMTGIWGYVIGNYIGYVMGRALEAIF